LLPVLFYSQGTPQEPWQQLGQATQIQDIDVFRWVLDEQRSRVTEQYILRIGFLGKALPVVENSEVLETSVRRLQ
jgi:hypothetical protein